MTPISDHADFERLHRDSLLRAVNRVLADMRRGHSLRLEHRAGRRCFSLSNGKSVRGDVAEVVITSPLITSNNDSLFEEELPQSWSYRSEVPA